MHTVSINQQKVVNESETLAQKDKTLKAEIEQTCF